MNHIILIFVIILVIFAVKMYYMQQEITRLHYEHLTTLSNEAVQNIASVAQMYAGGTFTVSNLRVTGDAIINGNANISNTLTTNTLTSTGVHTASGGINTKNTDINTGSGGIQTNTVTFNTGSMQMQGLAASTQPNGIMFVDTGSSPNASTHLFYGNQVRNGNEGRATCNMWTNGWGPNPL